MAPSYEQNTAEIGEIHSIVNLGLKRTVHEGSCASRTPARCVKRRGVIDQHSSQAEVYELVSPAVPGQTIDVQARRMQHTSATRVR